MTFPFYIETALAQYQREKSLFKKILKREHPAITAIKQLPDSEQDNLVAIIECLIQHPIDENDCATKVNDALLFTLFGKMNYDQQYDPSKFFEPLYTQSV